MAGELVPLVSPATPAIRLVGAGVVYSIDLPYLRDGLLAAGVMDAFDEYPYKTIRQEQRLIGRPANENWVTISVKYEGDHPGRPVNVTDQLTLGPLQEIYLRKRDLSSIPGEAGKSYGVVKFRGDGSIELLDHAHNESLVIGDVVKMAAVVAVGMYMAPYIVATVEAAAGVGAFVGPVETPLLVGPVETVLAPAAVADVAPFVGPIEVVTTTTPGWTLAETIAATKTAGTTVLEGAKVVNQVAGAIGAGAAVVAAIKGPQEQPTQSPAEKIGTTFSGFTDQLASVNKNVWYAVGGVAVLLAMG